MSTPTPEVPAMPHVVDITTVGSRTLAVTTFEVARDELDSLSDRMGDAFRVVAAHLAAAGITPNGPAVASYCPSDGRFSVAAGFDAPGDVTPGGRVDVLVLPAAQVAHTTHLGPYSTLAEAYEDLRRSAEADGWALVDDCPMWEEYWSGPETPEAEIRTEVFWPVRPG